MAEQSPKHGLTRSGRGWYKRVGKRPRWIVSALKCPTGDQADHFYEANFSAIAKRSPVPKSIVTLRQAAGAFVGDKEGKGLHRHTVRDYDDTMLITMRAAGAERAIAGLDVTAADAVNDAIAHMGTERRLKHIVNLRGFIKWCGRQGIACGWDGETFRPPKKAERRRERAKRRKPPYTHNDLRRLFRHASDRMRAVLLLGLNFWIGPDEIANLTDRDVSKIDFDKPRQKTGIKRLIPIWDETKVAMPDRDGLLFPGLDGNAIDPSRFTRRFHALCRRAAVEPRGLYHLRRTCRTVADEWGDQRAAALVMGRELPDTDTVYVLFVSRDRIARMLDHVKSSLRIDRALAARRYRNGQRGLALRLERRAARPVAKAKRSKPVASSATTRRPADKGSRRRH